MPLPPPTKKGMAMSHIITMGITPAMIPGIRKAIEVCEHYSTENALICVDEVEKICLTGEWRDPAKHETAVIHRHQSNISTRIADHLRALIGEGDVA